MDTSFWKLEQAFDDFLKRYDRDTRDNNQAHVDIKTLLERHQEFISSIRPWHKAAMWGFSIALAGTIGYAVKWILDKLSWG